MFLSEVKGTSAVLSVHGRFPESRAVILCLVYTRQSKGIACASSNSNLSGVVGLVGETTLSILILSSVVTPRRGRLLYQRNLALADMIVVGTMLLQITYSVQEEPANTSMLLT